MDGESFDRLAVVVHRLRERATRRQALQGLAAGGVAGLLARLGVGEAGAACVERRGRCSAPRECCGSPDRNVTCDRLPSSCGRNGDRCCGRVDARCSGDCDCCSRLTCGGDGRCRSGNGGGGDSVCGGTVCEPGFRCCRFNGVGVCYDPDVLRCCADGLCGKGQDCCGTGSCCSSGWKCCGNGLCCPRDLRCGKVACGASGGGDASAASARTVPFADPVAPDERAWIEKGWMQAGS
jgi:hypothetical protein